MGKAWPIRRIAGTAIYILACAIADWMLFPLVGWGVVGLFGVEVAILTGFPRFVEWLRK